MEPGGQHAAITVLSTESMSMICAECVAENGLREQVDCEQHLGECSYCQKSNVYVADASEIIDLIVECIPRHYEDPAKSVGYDSQEGGYLLPTFDSREVLEDAGLEMADPDFLDEAVKELDDTSTIWVETDPYSSRYDAQLMCDWADFSHQVKHVTRYTFFKTKVEHLVSGDSAVKQPHEVMGHIAGVIESLNAFRTIKAGQVLLRARRHPTSEAVVDGKAIGPAPEGKAKQNRMSPAGISAFYGGFELAPIIAEVRSPGPDELITFGRFEACMNLVLIDLSKITLSDSIFILEPTVSHEKVRFLREFRDEISKPIEPDDRVHIEYVPTQVLTEYLRFCFQPNGIQVHGIIYPSSLTAEGENVIIFCDENLGAHPHDPPRQTPWLKFLDVVE